MSSILEMLGQQLGGSNLRQISRQLNTDEKTAGSAISAALPILLGALAKNASSPSGARSLNDALAKDHDGSVLQNLGALLGNPRSGPGEGILRHVLGDRRPRVEEGISRATGVGRDGAGQLLAMLAPLVMGQLGQARRQGNLDANGIASLLTSERKAVEQKAPQSMGLLGALLDSDGDGDVDISDIAKQGAGLLGKLFGGK